MFGSVTALPSRGVAHVARQLTRSSSPRFLLHCPEAPEPGRVYVADRDNARLAVARAQPQTLPEQVADAQSAAREHG
jgi:hypothetical protein